MWQKHLQAKGQNLATTLQEHSLWFTFEQGWLGEWGAGKGFYWRRHDMAKVWHHILDQYKTMPTACKYSNLTASSGAASGTPRGCFDSELALQLLREWAWENSFINPAKWNSKLKGKGAGVKDLYKVWGKCNPAGVEAGLAMVDEADHDGDGVT